MTQRITITGEGNLSVRPYVTHHFVLQLVHDYFGLKITKDTSLREVCSYDDRVFIIKGTFNRGNCEDVVIRVANSSCTKWKSNFDVIDHLLLHLNKEIDQYKFPKPVYSLRSKHTRVLCKVPLQNNFQLSGLTMKQLEEMSDVNILVNEHGDKVYEIEHLVSLCDFIPGKTISVDDMNEKIAYEWGKLLGCVHKVMKTFPIPSVELHDAWQWNVLYASKLLKKPYLSTVEDETKKLWVTTVFDRYDEVTKARLEQLPKQFIHADANHENVLLSEQNQVIGFIDFNDCILSYAIVDLATLVAYVMLTDSNGVGLQYARSAYQGYISELPLNEIELSVLFNLAQIRFCQSGLIGEYQYKYIDADNEYLMATPRKCWQRLKYLRDYDEDAFIKLLTE